MSVVISNTSDRTSAGAAVQHDGVTFVYSERAKCFVPISARSNLGALTRDDRTPPLGVALAAVFLVLAAIGAVTVVGWLR